LYYGKEANCGEMTIAAERYISLDSDSGTSVLWSASENSLPLLPGAEGSEH